MNDSTRSPPQKNLTLNTKDVEPTSTPPVTTNKQPVTRQEGDQQPGSGTDTPGGRKTFRSGKKGVSARPSIPKSSSASLKSVSSQISNLSLDRSTSDLNANSNANNVSAISTTSTPAAEEDQLSSSISSFPAFPPPTPEQHPFLFRSSTADDVSVQAQYHALLGQVHQWLYHEKSKLGLPPASTSREAKSPLLIPRSTSAPNKGELLGTDVATSGDSQVPESTLALEKLERILSQYSADGSSGSGTPWRRRRGGSWGQGKRGYGLKGLRRGSASDSDYTDTELSVPSADVVLDNSKTLLYSGGEADSDVDTQALSQIDGSKQSSGKDREYWLYFKSEIVRLTHTLGFKGWRRVPLDAGGEVEVVRLSGALTNAVYLVSPPKDMSKFAHPTSGQNVYRKPPPKLLLRIYGPQVEHLIDREHELQVLRRLGKRNIGPRVLGTFKNGRFEQYLHARTLTTRDLRVPETSIQIAKRMRELHEGIELLPEEREAGPGLWKNWDKWVNRCEKVITWLDNEILADHNEGKAMKEPWRQRGFVCGVPWATFRSMVDSYRQWLAASFGGVEEITRRLIFAHNDTQYGNLLRLEPSGESPLLLPANEHKQLVVIDFEYASANMRGAEFANHFTEWCYNYHDEDRPWKCHANWYPTLEEQKRFIRAYLTHRPRLTYTETGNNPYSANHNFSTSSVSSTMTTPGLRPTYIGSPRVAPFNLDNYTPAVPFSISEDEQVDEELETEVQKLLHEVRVWRIANSAQWVAWGIVQAKVPGIEAALAETNLPVAPAPGSSGDATSSNGENEDTVTTPTQETVDVQQMLAASDQALQEAQVDEAADEFDYLAYAQDRALFFWADILAIGLIKEEELPKEMLEHIKRRMLDRNGAEFAEELFDSKSSENKTLAAHFPGSRWVFPTSRDRWSSVFKEDLAAWFDIYSLSNISEQQDLQVEGLRESTLYILEILSREIDLLEGRSERLALGGMSQGMATALWALLCSPGQVKMRIGAFVGMCGWLPFANEIQNIEYPNETLPKFLLDTIRCEEQHQASTAETETMLSTPVLLLHGVDDVWVDVELGRQAHRSLAKLGMKVEWNEHSGADNDGHWVKEPEGFDAIVDFLKYILA
ncbi:choline kinase [Arthroderma uncinatum]|uniref:choline kinase n=1 Tax=Arthroderma uncinatum TaxID=74035 RepID=UPI00144A9974|nr:choline kinase [Arthroderma uncinatum]KAF3481154.1 choline kinase [Arthroderma uncinatum]